MKKKLSPMNPNNYFNYFNFLNVRGKKLFPLFLFLGVVGLTAALPAKAVTQPAQIYIIQVQTTGGKNNTDEDYIELFNPGDKPVSLKGYRLVKRAETSASDTTIKVWDTDSMIPAKSFYLWANSAYVTISTKPDVTTYATLSDDNGIALRFGASNTGTLIDGFSWGKANNGFKNVSQINPSAGLGLYRQNWYTLTSGYYIATGKPFNSQTTDFAAAYAGSVAPVEKPNSSSTGTGSTSQTPGSGTSSTSTLATQQTGTTTVEPANPTPTPAPQQVVSSSAAKWDLILSGAALLVLIFLGYQFFIRKAK